MGQLQGGPSSLGGQRLPVCLLNHKWGLQEVKPVGANLRGGLNLDKQTFQGSQRLKGDHRHEGCGNRHQINPYFDARVLLTMYQREIFVTTRPLFFPHLSFVFFEKQAS